MDNTTSAQSLSVLRKFRSLGVVWGIFTICYTILVWVVFTQVREERPVGTSNTYKITLLVRTQEQACVMM